jgi:hypothetical protein
MERDNIIDNFIRFDVYIGGVNPFIINYIWYYSNALTLVFSFLQRQLAILPSILVILVHKE